MNEVDRLSPSSEPEVETCDYAGEPKTVLPAVPSRMATCPHCGEPLELEIEPAEVPVHRGENSLTIEPDVFACRSCGAALFATVSRELEDR